MIARARSKYVESRSRTASGSRASAIGVNPTRSAKSSDAVRLSDTGSDGKRSLCPACAGTEAPLSRPEIGVPHSLQNRPPPSGAPHTAQDCDIGRPHSLQNFAPARFSEPHRLQSVSDPAPGTSASFELRRDAVQPQPGPVIGTPKKGTPAHAEIRIEDDSPLEAPICNASPTHAS